MPFRHGCPAQRLGLRPRYSLFLGGEYDWVKAPHTSSGVALSSCLNARPPVRARVNLGTRIAGALEFVRLDLSAFNNRILALLRPTRFA
jgi:hypothetical protein